MPLFKAEEKTRVVSLRMSSKDDGGKKKTKQICLLCRSRDDSYKSQRLSRIQRAKNEYFDKPTPHFFTHSAIFYFFFTNVADSLQPPGKANAYSVEIKGCESLESQTKFKKAREIQREI